MEESFKDEVRRLWDASTGSVLSRLECLRRGLSMWDRRRKKERMGLKSMHTKKHNDLLKEDRSNDSLEDIIATRIQLKWEIDKDEFY